MHFYLVGLEAFNLILFEPPSTAFLCVHSDITMGPRCVLAGKALVRLCICPDWPELSMLAKQIFFISWHVFQIVLATLCLEKIILVVH